MTRHRVGYARTAAKSDRLLDSRACIEGMWGDG